MHPLIKRFFINPSKLTGFCTSYKNDRVFSFKKTAYDYMMYAKYNMESNLPGKNISAIMHIKKALSLQVDTFLKRYNLSNYAKKNNFTLNKEIILFGDLGIFPSRMVKEVYKIRNGAEYDFQDVEDYKVRNSFELINIFVLSLDRFIYDRPTSVEFTFTENTAVDSLGGSITLSLDILYKKNDGEIGLEEKDGILYIDGVIDDYDNDESIAFEKEKVSVYDEPNEYFFLLCYLVNYHRLQMYNPKLFFDNVRFFKSIKYKR